VGYQGCDDLGDMLSGATILTKKEVEQAGRARLLN
jgi:hypothetical protein